MQGEWNRVRVWSITWLSSPPDFCLTYTPTSKEKGPISVLCFVWEHSLYLESVSAPVSLWMDTSAPELPGLLTIPGWHEGTPSQPAEDCINLTISTCHQSQEEKTLRGRYICLKGLRNIVEDSAVLCSVLKTPRSSSKARSFWSVKP